MNGKQRIVEQSKQGLCDALVNLMEKENFQDISITEIAQNAELSRKTFYRYFKNKEQVVNYLCSQLFFQYFEQIIHQEQQIKDIMLTDTLDIFLNFWWHKRKLIQLLIRQGLFDHLTEIWSQNGTVHYKRFVAPWHVNGTPNQVNYVMAFQMGGFTNILRIWLCQKDPEQPEKVKDLMMLAAQQLASSLNTN